jgi:hypothetical protein
MVISEMETEMDYLRRERPKFPSGPESRLGLTIASWFSQRDQERNVVFAGGDRLRRSGGS